MGCNLMLPENYFFPAEVNGWEYDPEPYNGEAWFSPDREQSVVGFNCVGQVRGQIHDERCGGMKNSELIVEHRDVPEPEDPDEYKLVSEANRQANARLLDELIEWMREHEPGEWSHSLVNEAAFDAPSGFYLNGYHIEGRQDTLTYSMIEPEDGFRGQHIQIEGYRASGNYEASYVAVPEGKGSLPVPKQEIEVPEGRGLDVAIAIVRAYVREHFGDGDATVIGQTELQHYAGGESA